MSAEAARSFGISQDDLAKFLALNIPKEEITPSIKSKWFFIDYLYRYAGESINTTAYKYFIVSLTNVLFSYISIFLHI